MKSWKGRILILVTLAAGLLVGAASPGAPALDAVQSGPGPGASQPPIDAPPAQTQELPQFDQEAVARSQRERLDGIKKELRLMLQLNESDHFILFSDLQSRVREAVLIWLEDLRSKVITQLGIDPKERFWDGKCLVLVFERQESLESFARTFDNHQVPRPRGYFVLEARRSNEPRLVHLATFQPLEGGNEALREVLVHETTHALIELHKQSAPLPLWVHEGLAEYMTVLVDPTLRPRKQTPAFKVATATPYQSIRDIFDSTFPPSNLAAYSTSMSLIECLYAVDPGGVLRFVDLLKERVAPEEALGRAYPGFNYDRLEERWRPFVMRNYRPPPEQNDKK